MKKITVIVPIYNVEKYIDKCLDSLVKQTIFDELMLYLVDDGSTDQSAKIAQGYAQKYHENIQLFKKSNGGIASVRNFALAKVETPYFGFVDSDDYVEHDMYEKLLTQAESGNSDLVVCDFYYTYPDKESRFNEERYNDGRQMMTNVHAVVWNKLFKTDWIKQLDVDFIEKCRFEDVDFLYKIAPHVNEISFVDVPLIHYIQRTGSYMSTHSIKVLDILKVLDDIREYYIANNYYQQYHSELEYMCVKFCLGQPFRSACRIGDKKLRKQAQNSLFDYLIQHYPSFAQNKYLKTKKGVKHLYFRTVNKYSIALYAFIFSR